MNFKPAFIFSGQAEPSTNAQVFATYDEAYNSAKHRFYSWTMPVDFTVVETEDPVNYTFVNGYDEMINREVETS